MYAEAVLPDGHLKNVFVQRRTDVGIEVIVAEEASQKDTAEPDVRMLTFARGRRYEGEPGSARFRIIEFSEHGIPYPLPARSPVSQEPQTRFAGALWRSSDPADMAELQWRLSAPLMLMVLAVLAVPWAILAPEGVCGLGAGPHLRQLPFCSDAPRQVWGFYPASPPVLRDM